MKKKINWLLILQGWTMLWVVIGHAYLGDNANGPNWENMLGAFAYSFHMPLFMLISGWLFYLTRLKSFTLIPDRRGGDFSTSERQSTDENIIARQWAYWDIVKDKTLRLLLPGVVFSLVAFAVKIAFPGEVSRQASFGIKELLMAFLYPYDNPFREFWFIATLFWFFLMTPLWKWVLKRKWSMWMIAIILLAIHFLQPETQLLSLDRVCSHAVWFYMGLVISKEDWIEKALGKKPLFTACIGIAVYVVGVLVKWAILETVGGIVFSFGLALILDNFLPKTFFTFRNYTYQIFLMGIFAQIFVKIMFKHLSVPYMAAYILCVLMGLYVPVLVSKLIETINWKPLSLCVGLKPLKK